MPDRREQLGKLVRDTWVEWARSLPRPKPSWLTGWYELDPAQREVDMRIGEAVAADERARLDDEVARLERDLDNAAATMGHLSDENTRLRDELAESRKELERRYGMAPGTLSTGEQL